MSIHRSAWSQAQYARCQHRPSSQTSQTEDQARDPALHKPHVLKRWWWHKIYLMFEALWAFNCWQGSQGAPKDSLSLSPWHDFWHTVCIQVTADTPLSSLKKRKILFLCPVEWFISTLRVFLLVWISAKKEHCLSIYLSILETFCWALKETLRIRHKFCKQINIHGLCSSNQMWRKKWLRIL